MNDLLQPGQHLDAHPGADQLSAFAEHALPAREQQQTLAHLAVCADCRALVYLAQESEPVEPLLPQAQPAKTLWFAGWSRWNLAWPAALALGCVVLATVYLRHATTPASVVPAPATASVDQTQTPSIPLRAAPEPQPEAAHSPLHKKPQSPSVALTIPSTLSVDAIGHASIPVATASPAGSLPAVFSTRALTASLSGEGEISGVVTDKSGSIIPHAKITATNTETGVQITRESTPKGDYSLSPLPPGNYNVEVTAPGFQRLLQENVGVSRTQIAGLNMKLNVGSENTTVTITDAPPFLETANATMGGTIENELYTNLPLSMNGGPRNPTQFQPQMSGVQQGPPPGSSGGQTQGIYGGSGQQNLNENYIEGMPVSNIQSHGDNSPIAKALSLGAASAPLGATLSREAKPLPQLPSHLAAVSTAENGRQKLALDSAGALFRSDDAGVTWRPVSAQWQDKVKAVRLTVVGHSAPAPVYPQTLPDNALPPATAATVAQAVFELTTESGAVYTSPDGLSWTHK